MRGPAWQSLRRAPATGRTARQRASSCVARPHRAVARPSELRRATACIACKVLRRGFALDLRPVKFGGAPGEPWAFRIFARMARKAQDAFCQAPRTPRGDPGMHCSARGVRGGPGSARESRGSPGSAPQLLGYPRQPRERSVEPREPHGWRLGQLKWGGVPRASSARAFCLKKNDDF